MSRAVSDITLRWCIGMMPDSAEITTPKSSSLLGHNPTNCRFHGAQTALRCHQHKFKEDVMLKGIFKAIPALRGSGFGAYYSRIQRQGCYSCGPTADQAKSDYQSALRAEQVAGPVG